MASDVRPGEARALGRSPYVAGIPRLRWRIAPVLSTPHMDAFWSIGPPPSARATDTESVMNRILTYLGDPSLVLVVLILAIALTVTSTEALDSPSPDRTAGSPAGPIAPPASGPAPVDLDPPPAVVPSATSPHRLIVD